jgi:hypothetical protein
MYMEMQNKCACGGEIENGACKMCGMKMATDASVEKTEKAYKCSGCGSESTAAGKCCGMDMHEKNDGHNHNPGETCPVCKVK